MRVAESENIIIDCCCCGCPHTTGMRSALLESGDGTTPVRDAIFSAIHHTLATPREDLKYTAAPAPAGLGSRSLGTTPRGRRAGRGGGGRPAARAGPICIFFCV